MGLGRFLRPPGTTKPNQSFSSWYNAPPVPTRSFHLDTNAITALMNVSFLHAPVLSYDVRVIERSRLQRSPWSEAVAYFTE